jgi:hypothetical protein
MGPLRRIDQRWRVLDVPRARSVSTWTTSPTMASVPSRPGVSPLLAWRSTLRPYRSGHRGPPPCFPTEPSRNRATTVASEIPPAIVAMRGTSPELVCRSNWVGRGAPLRLDERVHDTNTSIGALVDKKFLDGVPRPPRIRLTSRAECSPPLILIRNPSKRFAFTSSLRSTIQFYTWDAWALNHARTGEPPPWHCAAPPRLRLEWSGRWCTIWSTSMAAIRSLDNPSHSGYDPLDRDRADVVRSTLVKRWPSDLDLRSSVAYRFVKYRDLIRGTHFQSYGWDPPVPFRPQVL